MLQTLLASGAVLQGFKAEMSAKAERLGVLLACGVVALVFFSVGLIALGVAAAVALTPILGPAGAPAAVGGGALLIAVILVWAGTRPRAPRVAVAPRPLPAAVVAGPYAGVSALGSALPGLSNAAAAAPIPWMIGALVLGVVLGRRR